MGTAVYMCRALIACMGKVCNKTSKVSHLQATINPPQNENGPPLYSVDTSPTSFFFMPCSERFGRAAGERGAHMACMCGAQRAIARQPFLSPFLSLPKTSDGLV